MPRRANTLRSDDIAALCGRTVVRVAELEALGLHRATIAHRCRPGGQWRSMCPGIVRLHNGPVRRDDRRSAGLLHAGPGAVITGLDALELHGLHRVPQPSGPVHTLVPADRRRVSHGLVLVERTTRLPEPAPGRWPLAPLPRAVLDFARRVRDRDLVRSAIAEVVQRALSNPLELATELASGSQRHSKLPRDVLLEVSDGIRSVAEAKAREVVRRSGLPTPMWNPRLVDARTGLFIAVPDAWFDGVGLVWEIDSYEWHLSPAEYEYTLARRVAMTAAGIIVLPHTPQKIRDHPGQVLAELVAHHSLAATRPRPAIHALSASPTSGTFVG